MNNRRSFITSGFFYLLILLVMLAIIYFIGRNGNNETESMNIVSFQQDMDKELISSVDIYPSANVPVGEVKATYKDASERSFYVSDTGKVEEILEKSEIADSYTIHAVKSGNTTFTIYMVISAILSIVLIIIVITSFNSMRAGISGGGKDQMANFGKSRAQRINPGDPGAKKFSDVAGLGEEKEQLEEVVDFLKEPDKFLSLGARIPKGIILVGPPGTGKTLLAKAVAGEAGVPFFSLSGSDFVEMFVGVGASRVRDMFAEAKKNAPCIIFIDEIDAVARRRGSGLGGGHDEREQTLNQMLVEMDGFTVNQGIIVMAATNRVDILDPAILRPGRFDRRIAVGRPDVRGREQILEVHTRNKPLGDDVDLKKIARTTVGFTGADLENLMNEAAIAAAKDDRPYINDEDISKSFIKIGIGTEKKTRVVSDRDKKITAYHESGHAILFHLLPDVGPVHIVSIIPTGEGAGGYTMPIDEKDDMYVTRGKMLQEIEVDLGGRIAESLIFDDITTGASQDIKQATQTARDMVTKYGFSDEVGLVNYADSDEVFIGRDYGHTKEYSEDIARRIDDEVKRIIDDCYDKAKEILINNIDILHRSAALLLEKERIDRNEFEALFNDTSADENAAEPTDA
ncbi:MAG: ATP-dependent zinc metalloprotease FtsH [Lachnospiraceae bacterium]|jgi:cell division protease FtsH|nr:ATP-dependent zinc metalloprotease FtsH [Lachnospiraceae bacterium]MEE3461776.1 ATP-dependent zinc metalloprotease FtsH [Lachnospiraceae bacterium]